jgi:methyl-accepting chemotaxis protein
MAKGVRLNFTEIVEITERIKQILNISNEVALKALNAMLIARQSGESARGFQVVSGELRRFSRQLESSMAEVMNPVFKLVVAVAEGHRHEKRAVYYRQLATDEACGDRIRAIVLGYDAQTVAGERLYAEYRNQLLARLSKARRLCAMGVTISRAARIEAIHGGTFAHELTQVATEVEVTVGQIDAALKTLEKSFGAMNSSTEKINEENAVDLSTRKSQVGGDCPRSVETGLRDRHQRVCDRPRQRTADR